MALPLHDDTPAYRPPVVTYLLITANVFVYLLTPLSFVGRRAFDTFEQWDCATQGFLARYAAIPAELITDAQLPLRKVIDPICVAYVAPFDKSPFLSAFFSTFLHDVNPLHIISNMLILFVYGAAVEQRLGSVRYLLFYFVCGYAATYGFALTYADMSGPLIGASGAIAGVTGAYIVLFPRARISLLVWPLPPIVLRFPAWVVLGVWFAGQWLALSAMADDRVAYWAHIYGFVVGALWGVALRRARNRPTTLVYGWR